MSVEDELRAQKDAAYKERDMLVAALAYMAVTAGHFRAWRGRHVGGTWDDDWRNIIFIELPTGQVSWHVHDSELAMFAWLPLREDIPWDGHSTPEKYRRLLEWASR